MFNRFQDEINLNHVLATVEADALLHEENVVHSLDPLDSALPIDQVMVEWTNNHPGAGALWCREGAQICMVM